ncbi:hypothetical protein [Yoonia sp.]|uniref:hypothetical protein n=1 Tax=Yoonia sp. TaxID=2212373 RepID=UPI00391CC7D4
MINSIVVTSPSVALIVIVSGMAAYVIARSKSIWLKALDLILVAGFAVPGGVFELLGSRWSRSPTTRPRR